MILVSLRAAEVICLRSVVNKNWEMSATLGFLDSPPLEELHAMSYISSKIVLLELEN